MPRLPFHQNDRQNQFQIQNLMSICVKTTRDFKKREEFCSKHNYRGNFPLDITDIKLCRTARMDKPHFMKLKVYTLDDISIHQ